MRGLVFKVWQRIGDVVLGAAGRGARFMDIGSEEGGANERRSARPIVPGRRIRPAFEVIEGGKGTRPLAGRGGSRPPKRPVLSSRRAS